MTLSYLDGVLIFLHHLSLNSLGPLIKTFSPTISFSSLFLIIRMRKKVIVLELVSHSFAISSGDYCAYRLAWWCTDRAHKSCSIHNVFLFPAGIEGRLPSRGVISPAHSATVCDDPTIPQ